MSDYNSFISSTANTRSKANKLGECTLCDLDRQNGLAFVKRNKKKIVSETVKVCLKCLSKMSKGRTHKCGESSKLKNICNMVQNNLGEKPIDQLLSKLIKNKECDDIDENGNRKLVLSQSAGKPLQVISTYKAKENKKSSISAESVLKIKVVLGLSSNKMNNLCSSLRVACNDRKLF